MAQVDSNDVPLGRLGPVRGRAHDVSITLTGLSFRQTEKGPRYPYPDFGSDFIEALHAQLTAPQRRGLFWSTMVCPWCDLPLDANTVGRVSVAIEVSLARIPPIRVELEMPGITCPGCDRALVMIDDRTIDSHLSDALIDAFAAAGFAPS